ncbi:MAG: deoxyribodipyrimidine photo-lyase [Pseudomonadota bacterium]
MSDSEAPIIVWFRDDLRLTDQPALQAAARSGRPVVAVYVLDDQTPGDWVLGGASRWWLHHSLQALAASLHALGVTLVLRRGRFFDCLKALVEETGASALHCCRGYEPWVVALEERLHEQLSPLNVAVKRYPGRLLFEPGRITTGSGDTYKVFTPFWRACLRADPPKPPQAAPEQLEAFVPTPASESLDDWALLPTKPDWSTGFDPHWTPGEAGAMAALERFLESALDDYHEARDVPGERGTSRLSPHLRFGEISPRQVWQLVANEVGGAISDPRAEAYLRELGWRDFNSHLLHAFPTIGESAFKPQYDAFPWRDDAEGLRAWQRGQTGYPIVDAGMRELWQTGWMHNRVRMIVGSFLVKHLLLPWRDGEDWFWDTLVDADLANNAGGWQWAAGSGADAAPYFRIFNPTLQGKKFDAKGTYVRHWVPEVAALPDKYLHEPVAAPAKVMEELGLVLGRDYPAPIVPHKLARERALAALKHVTG